MECFDRGARVASHALSREAGRHTTVAEHMPKSHREHAGWTPARLRSWANNIGVATGTLADTVMSSRRHPQQSFRSVMGILRLGKSYGDDRLEAACRRALYIGSPSYKSVRSILQTGLDRKPIPTGEEPETSTSHDNIRGSQYYN